MSQRDYEEQRSETPLENNNEEDNDSEVEYPMINLKGGLNNSLKERILKDSERYNNRKQKLLKLKSTEFSPKIMIDNKLAQFQMAKAVNYIFSEFDYIKEKIRRTQENTMKQLQEIHLDKRKQIRESYKYHNEETRYAMQRMRDQEKFLEAQAILEDTMRKRKRSIAKLSFERRELMKEIKSKDYKKVAKKNKKDVVEKNDCESIERRDLMINSSNTLRSRSFLHAGAIEVTRDVNNPKTVKRTVEIIENIEKPLLDTTAEVVESKEKGEKNVDILKGNFENNVAVKENIELFEENNETVNETIKNKKKSAIQIMKERKLQKEKKLKEILNLPFNTYRKNSKGKLQKIDNPVPKHEYQEQSNREKYNMRKVLSGEKEKYQNYICELKNTTEMIVQEDKNISRRLNTLKLKPLKDNIITEYKPVGPNDWMRAYVSSNIPDDIDPSSTEAIIYCRYIRAPLHKYSHLPNYKLYHTPL